MNGESTAWLTKRVDQLCDLGRGRVISQEEIYGHSGTFPVFSSQSKDDGVLGFLNSYDFEGEYVTWTTDGANAGTVFFRSGRFNCTNVCGTLKPKSDATSARFLARSLSTVAKRYVSYVGNPKLMNNVMAAIQLHIPPRPVQDVVAAVLDTIDAAIAKTAAVIAKLKQVRAGLLHDLLTRGLDANGELRDTLRHPEQFQDSPLGRIPREWDCKLLLDPSCTKWFSGGTPDRSQSAFWNGPVPFLTPKDMKVFAISDTIEHVSEFAAQCGSRLMPTETVFIVVRGMILAHTFPVCLSMRPFAFNQDIKAVQGGSSLSSRFLGYWFSGNANLFLRKATEATHGTKKLDMSEINRVILACPPLDEQPQIIERIDRADKLIEKHESEFDILRQLKSGLMSDLLTGRVPVPEGIATGATP